jgi:hypothetical protein
MRAIDLCAIEGSKWRACSTMNPMLECKSANLKHVMKGEDENSVWKEGR